MEKILSDQLHNSNKKHHLFATIFIVSSMISSILEWRRTEFSIDDYNFEILTILALFNLVLYLLLILAKHNYAGIFVMTYVYAYLTATSFIFPEIRSDYKKIASLFVFDAKRYNIYDLGILIEYAMNMLSLTALVLATNIARIRFNQKYQHLKNAYPARNLYVYQSMVAKFILLAPCIFFVLLYFYSNYYKSLTSSEEQGFYFVLGLLILLPICALAYPGRYSYKIMKSIAIVFSFAGLVHIGYSIGINVYQVFNWADWTLLGLFIITNMVQHGLTNVARIISQNNQVRAYKNNDANNKIIKYD
jgi:hypothetical protein